MYPSLPVLHKQRLIEAHFLTEGLHLFLTDGHLVDIEDVVHVERAVKSSLEDLQENDLIEGVKLAYANRDNEEYEALYPKGAPFELI